MRNDDPRAAVRLDLTDPLLTDVENWRRSQEKIPSRTDAIRQLVKRALEESEQHGAAA
jgi:metal-responsive CopG/Arc/MetJ family transcriptional regulator